MKLGEISSVLEAAATATEAYFSQVETLPPTEALVQYYRFKTAVEDLVKQMKRLNTLKAFQQYGPIPQIMVNNGIRTYTDDDVNVRFSMESGVRVKILDKPPAHDWLRSEGMGDIITTTVNAQTLGAAMKAWMMEKRIEPPEDVFQVTRVLGVKATKVKPKAEKF